MADDEEYDIHPLDRDYSQPLQPTVGTARQIASEIQFNANMRKSGTIIFVIGLIVLFLSAIIVSNFRGGLEEFGSFLNRFSMLIMLAGAILIVLAYRIQAIKTFLARSGETRDRKVAISGKTTSLGGLALASLVAYVLIVILGWLLLNISPMAFYLFVNFALTIASGLMVTIAVWNRGVIRAYAIGIAVGIVWNTFSIMFGNFWGPGFNGLIFVNLATVFVSGLVCSAYVLHFAPTQPWESSPSGRIPISKENSGS